MSKTVKILLIVGTALLLLCGTCVGGAVIYFKSKAGDLKAMGNQIKAEAEAFAATTDEQGCLDESLRRSVTGGLMDEVGHGLFLGFCLAAAAPTEGFCDGVPEEKSIMRSVTWRLAACREHPEVEAQRCSRLLAPWQRHCHPG